MAENSVVEKSIIIIHKENGCGGQVPNSIITIIDGLLVLRGHCNKCRMPVTWKESMLKLIDESPKTAPAEQLLLPDSSNEGPLTEQEREPVDWCKRLHALPSDK